MWKLFTKRWRGGRKKLLAEAYRGKIRVQHVGTERGERQEATAL